MPRRSLPVEPASRAAKMASPMEALYEAAPVQNRNWPQQLFPEVSTPVLGQSLWKCLWTGALWTRWPGILVQPTYTPHILHTYPTYTPCMPLYWVPWGSL